MKKKPTAKILKKTILVALWLLIVLAAFWAWEFYQYEQEHPQKKYEYNIFEEPPEEAQIKVSMYNRLQNTILIGVLLVFIYFILDFFNDFMRWAKKIEQYHNKLEEKNETKERTDGKD